MKKSKFLYRVVALLGAFVVFVLSLEVSECYKGASHRYVGDGFVVDDFDNYYIKSEKLSFCYSFSVTRISNTGVNQTTSWLPSSDSEIFFFRARKVVENKSLPSAITSKYGYMEERAGTIYMFSKTPIRFYSSSSDEGSTLNYKYTFDNGDVWYCAKKGAGTYKMDHPDFFDIDFATIYESVYDSNDDIVGHEIVEKGLLKSLGVTNSYSSSLGYLQNVSSKKMIIDGDKQGTQTKYKFSFDTTSSSGVDLTSGDYVIKLYEQTAIYKGGIWQPFRCPRVHIGDYDASKGYLDFNIADAMTKTDAVTGDIEGYDFLSIALNGYVRADSYYLQIYNKTTGEYGGFVEMKNNPNLPGQFSTSTVHGSEDDMSGTNGTDMNGYVDKIVDTNIGIGTDYENAELDADRGDGLEGFDDLTQGLNDMTSTISAIPKVIGSLFSFLPPWCLGLCATGFGLLIFLIIFKAAT